MKMVEKYKNMSLLYLQIMI